MLTTNEIRKKFLDFFKSKGHTIVESDSLVPKDDPTVLFTTAGMQQFKRQFLGHLEGYTRAATSQKCLRTDDLEKVGKTPVHHTFFEMLGNFSFGDYFKKEAIQWAWEFFVEVLKIPPDKLWVSVYEEDCEAHDVWCNVIHVPKEKILKLGDKDNFWPAEARQKGPNGPCGPCSEIFYDFGKNPMCPNKSACDPTCSCGRFAEVWNLVFTQFNRKDGGVLEPLPAKNIDTGMGLERLVAVMQGKKNNFETDLFQPILKAIDDQTQKFSYIIDEVDKKIIADHIRAITFGIADGVVPSNEGRGYIMKRLIIDATDKLVPMGQKGSQLHDLIPVVVDIMRSPYPEIAEKADSISKVVWGIQQSYLETRDERIPELHKRFQQLSDISAQERPQRLGELLFLFRDTYGLTKSTLEKTLTQSTLDENVVHEAWKHYEQSMTEQKEKSRAASKMTGDVFADAELNLNVPKTEFTGYEHFRGKSKILKIFKGNLEVTQAQSGDEVKIVFDSTPFYAESGGQLGDTGTMTHDTAVARINDTQKIADVFIHSGKIEKGSFMLNDPVELQIDEERRMDIMRNHTATHLLQASLRKVLGPHVQQQGSLVAPDRLRFDFTHPRAVTKDELRTIESAINAQIKADDPVEKNLMPLKEAKESGAMAFFAEKYKDVVRVVSIDGYSRELCGGTHLKTTGEIKTFKITAECAVAQGIRRIEARTGNGAIEFVKEKEQQDAKQSADQEKRLKDLDDRKRSNRQFLDSFKGSLEKHVSAATVINGTSIIHLTFDDIDVETLRRTTDLVKQRVASTAVIAGSSSSDSAVLVVAVSQDLIAKGIAANQIVKELPPEVPFYGGGQPHFAQAGCKDPKQLPAAIKKVQVAIERKLMK